jgi:hypothetical protein
MFDFKNYVKTLYIRKLPNTENCPCFNPVQRLEIYSIPFVIQTLSSSKDIMAPYQV